MAYLSDKLFKMAANGGHNLQISLGKAGSAPTCLYGLMALHVAAKDHEISLRGAAGL